jgi:hypothetical protein
MTGSGLEPPTGEPVEPEQRRSAATASFTAVADAAVLSGSPAQNFGSTPTLLADTSPQEQSLLRFNVTGLSGTVTRAVLRLYVSNGSADGPRVYRTASGWTEGTVTWNTRPAVSGSPLFDLGSVSSGTFVELDVTSAVSGNGEVNLALVAASSDGMDAASRETAQVDRRPTLIVTTGSTPPPPTRRTFTFASNGDATLDSAREYQNFGRGNLFVDAAPDSRAVLRFELPGLTGEVVSAKLRLFAFNGTSNGPKAYLIPSSWNESEVTWDSSPSLRSEGVLGDAGAVGLNRWMELDVTDAFTGQPRVAFELRPDSTDGVDFYSREHTDPALRPQLVVVTEQLSCAPANDTPSTGSSRWARGFQGMGRQTGMGITVDAAGNAVALIDYDGAVDFGGGTLPNHGTEPGMYATDNDIAVVRYTPGGAHLASRGFGVANGYVLGRAVVTLPNGDVVITGDASAPIDLGGGSLGMGSFVARLTPALDHVWSRHLDFNVQNVAVDPSGAIIVIGDMPKGGTAGEANPLVEKYSGTGTRVWRKEFLASVSSRTGAVATDRWGNIFVGGELYGSLTGDGVAVPESPLAPYVLKLNPSGAGIWTKRFESAPTPYHQRGVLSLATLPDGAVVISGYFDEWLRVGSERRLPTGLYTSFIAVRDADGHERWQRWFGNEGSSIFPRTTSVDAQGDIVITGEFGGSLDFGGGPLVTPNHPPPNENSQADGFFIAKFRPGCGEHRYSRVLSNGDYAYFWGSKAAVAPDGSAYWMGSFEGHLDTGVGVLQNPDPELFDVMLLRLNP